MKMNYEDFFKDYMKENKSFYLVVKTNKNISEIVDFKDGIFYLNIKEKPIEGKANLEIIKFFKRQFNCKIDIVSGKSSKKKLIKIL